MGLERIHGRLRMDLAAFSPWMANEKIKLLLYRDRDSYAKGELSPPPWSNGIAFYEQKLLALYEQKPPQRLLQITAHETTHLLFESYWGEAHKRPPSWLNEGLAMNEETDSGAARDSDWYRMMLDYSGQFPPLERFMKVTPTQDLADSPSDDVALWYCQAYSVVYFLARKHGRLQFQTFVAHLREGDDVAKALWESYGYLDLGKFEADWRQFLGPGSAKKGKKKGLVTGGERFGHIDGLPPLR